MAAIYSNENYPLGIVEELRVLGHDVMTAQQAGNAGRSVPDEEVLRFATSVGRAVVTHNRRHFFRLDHQTEGHDPDAKRQAGLIDAAIRQAGETLAGKVLRIYRPPL